MRHNIWKGTNGVRAGWRVLIYLALVVALGYATSKIGDTLSHGRQYDFGYPSVAIVAFLLESLVILLAAGIMAKFEGRSIAEYGLPWRRAFCGRFWMAWAGWPEIAVFLIRWFLFAKWLRQVKYPQSAASKA